VDLVTLTGIEPHDVIVKFSGIFFFFRTGFEKTDPFELGYLMLFE